MGENNTDLDHYVAGFESRLVLLSKALYHTCFICGQRCKCWSRRPKLTSSVISDVKPIIYILSHLDLVNLLALNSAELPTFESVVWGGIFNSHYNAVNFLYK